MRSRFLSTLMLLFIVAVLSGCAATVAEAPAADVPTGYANPAILVDTNWVAEHSNDPNVRLLDVSNNLEAFESGHLPGAQYVNWQADLTNPDDPVRSQILTGEALSELLSRLGVENDDTIIVYDNTRNLFAARAYWVLKYYQHGDVRVYNGGSKKWTAAGRELVTEVMPVTASQYVAGAPDPAIRTTWEYVVEHVDDPATLFCDARGPKEYTGTDVQSAQGGHIPGAINVEWSTAVNPDGTFREAQALAELYQEAGFTPDKEIITYCQTGVRGAHAWFVLKELLGYPNVRNYDGSWEEYGNKPESPIES